jgi:hypothetical protein
MSLQPLENKVLSRGIIEKSASLLAEITIRKSQAILQGYHPTPKLHATIWVTVFLLDSLFQAGYRS